MPEENAAVLTGKEDNRTSARHNALPKNRSRERHTSTARRRDAVARKKKAGHREGAPP